MEKKKQDDHSAIRLTMTWGSRPKGRRGPVNKVRAISELSDSHLLHIIGHILQFDKHFKGETLDFVLAEAKYRSEHGIFVAEYQK